MRKFLFLILASLSFFACTKSDKYVIHGNLRCVNAQEAYMMEMSPLGTLEITDSTPIHSGDFKFKGHVDYPTMRFIKVGSCRPFDVFVENSQINIRGSVLYPDEITVTGSYSQTELNFLMDEYKAISDKRNSILVKISNAKKKRDVPLEKKLSKHYESLPDSLLSITERFIASNPTSFGGAYFVCSLSESFPISKLAPIIEKFDPSMANSQYVKYLNDELALSQKFTEGSQAPDFDMLSIDGDSVSLKKYTGKYLYVDFGASWCKETENRNEILLDIYHQYHSYGLEMLSVSLDWNEDQWHDFACKDPELPWEQVCDFLYWSSPITKRYCVNKIPYGILISPEGKILKIDNNRITLGDYLKKSFGR